MKRLEISIQSPTKTLQFPEVANAFVAYNNARGMQAGRLFQAYSAYHREILGYSEARVNKINASGGLRIFSFSDFEAHHLIDLVQVLTDCARKGIKVQGYTKVPEFARAVKDTGMKLNRSLIAKGDGYVDADYTPKKNEAVSPNVVDGKRLLLDCVEGIDVNHKDFFDSSSSHNVGNILVGINDDQIRLAMVDPFVDYIIPFHSGLSEAIRKQKGIGNWQNYKLEQLEKKDNGSGKLVNADKHGVNIYTEVLNEDIKTEKQFVERYLEVCKEKGWIPKFHRFLNKNKNGDFVYTKGYYKLLLDFKMFDSKGRILPQEVVQPIFDDAFNKEILEDYVKGEKTKMPNDEVYNKVKEALNLGGAKYSLATDVASILEEYDTEGVKYGSILDVADGIESLIAESTEDTTELENILNDFRASQDDARRWGNRMDSGGEEEFEEALRAYVNKATLGERSDADSHNSSSEGLPLESSERLSGNALASPKDVAKIGKNTEVTHRSAKNIINEGGLKKEIKTPAQAVSALGKGLHMEKSNSSQSYYGDFFEGDYIVYGNVVHLRISTHPATPVRMGNAEADHKVSIVIRKNGEHKSDGTPHSGYTEYVYEPSEITPQDAANAVVKGVKSLLETGEFVDETGKAVRRDYPYTDKSGTTMYSLITPEMDATYLDAVERGDMATAQRMVMEAAKLAMPNTKVVDEDGNPKVVYHGDRKKARYIFSTDTFFTPDAKYAKRYTNSTGEVYATYLDIKKPFDIRDKKAYDIFTEFRGGRKPVATTTGAMDWAEYSYEDLQEYVEDVAPNEYDGFILDEGADPDGNGGVIHRGLSYVPFAPNQIKSADPVTYDDAGNIIPLSERFNPRKEDIRYSLIGEMGASNIESYGRYGSPAYALEQARDMEADGKSVKEIRVATNWERGKDGKWRYEINDGVYIDPEDKDKEYKLSDILKNDALYEAYSELADMPVYYAELEGNSRGMYDGEAIWLSNTLDEQQAHSTLVHEVQHAIQHREGFARGGNKGMFEQEAIEKLEQTLGDLEKEKDKFKSYNKLRKAYLILKYVANSLRLDRAESKAYEQYRRLAGEVEARNVQARMNMSEEERLLIPIGSTEDVARSSQNVIQRELMEADGTRYSLREESAPTRYSLQSGDMPFFNDNGDIITFDNTDITGEDYDAVELRSPMPTTPRTTEDVIKAHLSARHNAAKELFENQKISVPLRDSFIGKIVNELHNEYKSRKEGEDFTGADSANREEANKVDNQGLWRGYSEAGPSGDIARRGRVLAPTRYSLQSDDIPLLRDNLLKQKDRYEKGRGETAFVINRDDNGKSTESNINGNNRNIEKDGAYWRPSNKKQRSSLQDTDYGENQEETFRDRRGSKYNGDSRRDILTSLSLPRHFGFPRCFFYSTL